MPSAGFPTAHSTTSSMFPSSATSGTSVFDSWHFRSSKKAPTDTASVRSASTTSTASSSLLSLDEQKARAQGLPPPTLPPMLNYQANTPRASSKPKTLSFRDVATKGWNRPFPKY
ncbi:hypothetical protein MMC32_007533 [Xylographa parallela]|nr:hypothetical protein [Xylographa parallela]